jgi:hypothetical protein
LGFWSDGILWRFNRILAIDDRYAHDNLSTTNNTAAPTSAKAGYNTGP